MAIIEPAKVYQRTDSNGLDYWTVRPSLNVESELRKIEHLKKFGAAAYEGARAAILSHHDSEKTADSLDDLARISEFVNYYGPLVNQSKEAQKNLTLAHLIAGTDLDEIKEAVGKPTSWLVIQSWAGKFTGIGNNRKFVEWLIPASIGKLIDEKVKAGSTTEDAAA
jgi:hypothetical protein